MIFSKVRVTTKKEKCQSSLCRSTLGNHSALGLCFLLGAPSSGPTDEDVCEEGRALVELGRRRRRSPQNQNNVGFILVKKALSYMFNLLFLDQLRLWALSSCTWCNLETTAARSQPTASERRGRRTLIHKCLLHALNGCSPWWISSPDALSMRCSLSASQPEPRARRRRHLFPSSVLL